MISIRRILDLLRELSGTTFVRMKSSTFSLQGYACDFGFMFIGFQMLENENENVNVAWLASLNVYDLQFPGISFAEKKYLL